MIDPLFSSDTVALAQRMLDAANLRQQAIASNLANAETPGYRRVDLSPDFATHLKASLEAGQLNTAGAGIKPTLSMDPNARAVRPDGNNVEMDHELVVMDQNAVNYEYLADVVTHNIKQLKLAITGQG
jgi:flagellar basal-body rod protein FlgB